MKSKKRMASLLMGAALMGMTAGGCGSQIKDDAVFATLDDTKITMGVANFFAKYEQAAFDSMYLSYFGENMWSNDLYGNGNTLTEDVKSDVAEELQEMYLLKAHMEEYKVSLTEEEEKAIEKAADDFLAANTKEAIRQIGAENRENVLEMLRLRTIENKMHERIIQDADTTVTEEEAAQRTFSYMEIGIGPHTDEDSNQVEYTDEEKAQFKAAAESISKAEDFETAVTEAGYTVTQASYGSAEDDDSIFDKAVLEAADKLKEGEVSGVVEAENSYYVLRLDSEHDEEATKAKKEELIEEKQNDYYNDLVDGWKEAAKWKINEKEWEKVTFEDHFARSAEEETETPEEAVSPEGASDAQSTEEAGEPSEGTEESVETTEAK